MYLLFHDDVAEGVPEGVVFLIEHESRARGIIRIVQWYLAGRDKKQQSHVCRDKEQRVMRHHLTISSLL